MWYLALLLLLGLLFLVAEIVLLPGLTVAALLALVCDGSAVWLAFTRFGTTTGVVVLLLCLGLSLVATIFSLRAKTWQRFSLQQEIRSSSAALPSESVACGARGYTCSRLAPMGQVEIDGRRYEAKSTGAYIDPQTEVEVVGFENFSIIVKPIKTL